MDWTVLASYGNVPPSPGCPTGSHRYSKQSASQRGLMMRRIHFVFLASIFAAPALYAVEPGSVEAFFRPSEFTQVTLSPDGTRIATRHSGENYENNLLLLDADSLVESNQPEVQAITSFEVGGVGGYIWKNNDRLLFFGQADIREEGASGGSFVGAYSIGVDGSQPRKFLSRYCQAAGNRGQGCYPVNEQRDYVALTGFGNILDVQRDNDRYLTIASGSAMASPYADVFRIDTRTGRLNKIEDSPGTFTQWFVDGNQQRRLGVAHIRGTVESQLMYRATEDDEWQAIYQFELQDAQVYGFDGDNHHVIIRSRRDSDRFAVYRMNPDTGDLGEAVISDPEYDIETVYFTGIDGGTQSLAYGRTRGDIPRKYFVSDELAAVQETIDYYFPDTQNDLVSWDDAENRFIVRAWNDRQAGRYYLLDLAAGKLRFLFDARPWQNPEEMGEMRTIEYTARDGTHIEGYITLPAGWDGEPVGLILNPHGGPYGPRDQYGWAPEAQFFASHGWATLQVNYRGSGGYGRHFEQSPYRQWGLEMQDDLSDAVAWAIEEGYTESDNVCIYGASYGGYATLQGLTATPELYQCGVSYVAVSSLTSLLDLDTRRSTAEFRDTFMGTIMRRYLGDPSNAEDMERLRATSPLYHVENIRVPLLAIHGEADPRVDIDTQFYPLVRELRSQDKDFEQIVGAYEGHGFFTGDVTIDLYTRMAAFLGRHLN
jgi:dipeptidyl aminopeptidase/acylaminoacyl peptidase